MTLALLFIQVQTLPPQNAPQVEGNCGVSMQTNSWEIIEDNLLTKHFFESKGLLY